MAEVGWQAGRGGGWVKVSRAEAVKGWVAGGFLAITDDAGLAWGWIRDMDEVSWAEAVIGWVAGGFVAITNDSGLAWRLAWGWLRDMDGSRSASDDICKRLRLVNARGVGD